MRVPQLRYLCRFHMGFLQAHDIVSVFRSSVLEVDKPCLLIGPLRAHSHQVQGRKTQSKLMPGTFDLRCLCEVDLAISFNTEVAEALFEPGMMGARGDRWKVDKYGY